MYGIELTKKAIKATLDADVANDLKDLCNPLNALGFNSFFYSRFSGEYRVNLLSNNYTWLNHLLTNIDRYRLRFENLFHFRPGFSIDFLNSFQSGDMTVDMIQHGMRNAIYLSYISPDQDSEVFIFTKPEACSNQELLSSLLDLNQFCMSFKKQAQQIITTTQLDKTILSEYAQTDLSQLTPRQHDCLYYLSRGMTLKQIARVLHLSPRTVEHYIENLRDKINCDTRAQLIEKALHLFSIKKY